MNNDAIAIDIKKAEFDAIKPLYHSLIRLQTAQLINQKTAQLQSEFIQKMMISEDPMKIKDMSFKLAEEVMTRYYPVDFSSVWDSHGSREDAQRR
jgi:hypothetical protein